MQHHNKISDELIIAYIEGNLSEEEALKVERLIDSDNLIFSRYAVLNRSYRQLEDTSFEVTPDSLKEKLNISLGLEAEEIAEKGSTASALDKVNQLVNNIFQLRPQLAIVSAAFVAFLSRVLFLSSEPIKNVILYTDNNMGDKARISELVHSLDVKSSSYLSSKEKGKNGIDISIKNDTLSIEQPLKIPRKVYIYNYEQNIFLEKEITDRDNKISLDDFKNNDSLRITIETAGIIIYDNWTKLE